MTTKVKKPRWHAELIKQWAEDDSLIIETQMPSGIWKVTSDPMWLPDAGYRIQRRRVTKWKWALQDEFGDTVLPTLWLSEEELLKVYPNGKHYMKLVWTEKEFEVD